LHEQPTFPIAKSLQIQPTLSSTSLGVPQQGQLFHNDLIEDFSQLSLTSNDIKNLSQKDVTSHITTHDKFHHDKMFQLVFFERWSAFNKKKP
jgi:hypothetical protein